MKRIVAGLITALAFAASAFATPITYTHTGFGSGRIGAASFSDAAFTITATGDTANRASSSGGYFIDNDAAFIDISGLGTFSFLTGTRYFVYNGGNIVGFSRAGSGGLDLFNGPTSNVFGAWDMTASIGPVFGHGNLIQWTAENVVTSAGVLVFSDGVTPTTFQATVGAVPEPETYAMLLAGLGLLGFMARGRKNRQNTVN
jgi:hypothetical protein